MQLGSPKQSDTIAATITNALPLVRQQLVYHVTHPPHTGLDVYRIALPCLHPPIQ